MKKYVKLKKISLYDFLIFTTIETKVVISNCIDVLFEGNAEEIIFNNDVGGYIIDSISSSKSGTIYLEVHKK